MGLRAGNLQDADGRRVFASDNLQETGQKLYYQSHEVLMEGSDLLIQVVSSLPTAASNMSGRYFFLTADEKIYKCSQIDSVWTWVQVVFSSGLSFISPLVEINGDVSINGINTSSGSESKFLTEKGTFKTAISLTIDPTSKHWLIDGSDTGIVAEGRQGDVGYVFTPSVDSSGVISWTNNGGLPNPSSISIKGSSGDRGATIYIGDSISGSSSSASFPGSGISNAIVGDMYLNQNTWSVYKCIYQGSPSTALWAYIGVIQGPVGPALSIGASGTLQNRSAYDTEQMNFIYADNSGFIYRKVSNTSGDWSDPIQIKGDKGDAFTYSDFTPSQLEGLKGPKGDSPVLTIDPTTKHWKVDGIDTGIVAEGTGQYSPGVGISVIGSTISIAGASSSGSESNFLNQKGQFSQVMVPAVITAYNSTTKRATAQPVDPETGQTVGNPVTNLIVDWEISE